VVVVVVEVVEVVIVVVVVVIVVVVVVVEKSSILRSIIYLLTKDSIIMATMWNDLISSLKEWIALRDNSIGVAKVLILILILMIMYYDDYL
jgi:hypothetical protein